MFTFPHDVDGWLSEPEGHALAVFARGKEVLEIGSYKGRSTICMAQTAKHIVAIDPHDGRGCPEPQDTFGSCLENLGHYGAGGKVHVWVGTIEDEASKISEWMEGEKFDLVFIDAHHDLEEVRKDTEYALALLQVGGLIAYHDYGAFPGVTQAVNELLEEQGSQAVFRVDSLIIVAPAERLITGKGPTRVFMAMPHRGSMKAGAARAFLEYPTNRRMDLIRQDPSSSVLELNFNRAWCEALEQKPKGAQYFVMLHDDVCPGPGWLDIMVDEIQRTGADVVSAVIPIKSEHGLTSTALGTPQLSKGSHAIFSPIRRVTMHELFDLPETFGREDIPFEGPPALFINTGCWIADLSKSWVKNVVFTNLSRNVGQGDQWTAHCVSEDWVFSSDLARWNAKVMATRKVALYHDHPIFHNTAPWGTWREDESYFEGMDRLVARQAERALVNRVEKYVAQANGKEAVS